MRRSSFPHFLCFSCAGEALDVYAGEGRAVTAAAVLEGFELVHGVHELAVEVCLDAVDAGKLRFVGEGRGRRVAWAGVEGEGIELLPLLRGDVEKAEVVFDDAVDDVGLGAGDAAEAPAQRGDARGEGLLDRKSVV